MNTVGEIINYDEIRKQSRNLNPEELMQLLRADFWRFATWGASAFTIDNKNDCRMMRFKVNGHHHKGHVYIFVSGDDLFEVYLTSLQGTIKESTEQGLYFDMLFDWIDKRIEYIDEYEW